MKHNIVGWKLCGLLTMLMTFTASAEEFAISIGQPVSENVPGPGAGIIEASTATDVYTFSGTNGQVIFLEEISVSAAFKGWLYWNLKSPAGLTLMTGYFQGDHEGRKVLPENGTYSLSVYVLANDPAFVGNYSFRIRPVPSDTVFPIQIGDTVSLNSPASGAGSLEQPGEYDIFEFTAQAGQHAWFEELGADPAFAGWLQWEVKGPSGQTVFRSYIGGSHEGRKTFKETGIHRLTVFSGLQKTNHVGAYSFRIRPVQPDASFPVNIGDTVTNGVPSAGAGNIEMAGAWDYYTFTGTAGQSVFFEHLDAAGSLGGYLHWETRTPSGQLLFSGYIPGSSIGRKTLPETGTYTIRLAVLANDPSLVGTYSFRLKAIDDSAFPLEWGQTAGDGVPAPGAGRIETAGGQDFYTFEALAGQKIVLQELYAAPEFAGWLRWELLGPQSNRLGSEFLTTNQKNVLTLPAAGKHTIRIYAGANNSTYVGNYSFRIYSEVFAGPDQGLLSFGGVLQMPKASLLCNDVGEPGELFQVSVANQVSAKGGSVTMTGDHLIYTPAAGFQGTDSFAYLLHGKYGDTSMGSVTVHVAPDAQAFASVVSHKRAQNLVTLCLLGLAATSYLVETSPDMQNWTVGETLSPDDYGAMSYTFEPDVAISAKYFRFRRQ